MMLKETMGERDTALSAIKEMVATATTLAGDVEFAGAQTSVQQNISLSWRSQKRQTLLLANLFQVLVSRGAPAYAKKRAPHFTWISAK